MIKNKQKHSKEWINWPIYQMMMKLDLLAQIMKLAFSLRYMI